MNKIRIGFVGVGGMGQCAHLRNYVTVPDCEVVAIAEIREQLGKKVAERYGVPRVYKNHEEMLAKEKLDGIVASHMFTRHGVLIPELLKAGVPVFSEKPLAGSVAAGEKIVEAVKESGTWHMVGYHKRSDPAVMFAKKEIDALKQSGELGKLRYVRILMPAGEWVQNGFLGLIGSDEPVPQLEHELADPDMDKETYDRYFSFINYYIHQINLMRHLLGEDYEVTYADPSQVVLAVRSSGGAAGIIEMNPYTTTIDWQESALVAFEHGYVNINLPCPMVLNRAGTVEIFKDPGGGVEPQTVIPKLPSIHAMRQQAMNFCAAVKGEIEPLTHAKEALKDLEIGRQYIQLLG